MGATHLLVQGENCRHVAAAIAVVRSAPHGDQVVVRKHVFVPTRW